MCMRFRSCPWFGQSIIWLIIPGDRFDISRRPLKWKTTILDHHPGNDEFPCSRKYPVQPMVNEWRKSKTIPRGTWQHIGRRYPLDTKDEPSQERLKPCACLVSPVLQRQYTRLQSPKEAIHQACSFLQWLTNCKFPYQDLPSWKLLFAGALTWPEICPPNICYPSGKG